jgi:hypothetical protein
VRGRNLIFVVLALALAGCDATPPPPDFVLHANAVQEGTTTGKPAKFTPSGLELLVPVGSCAIGIGRYDSGDEIEKAGIWTGNADCTSFTMSTTDTAGLLAVDAVALPDGSLVGPASSELRRLSPDGTVTTLADLDLLGGGTKSGGRPYSIVRSGDRLVVAGGRISNQGKTKTPVVWTSDDGGESVTEIELPPVNGWVGAMAADGDTIVAAEKIDSVVNPPEKTSLGTWRSVDGGRSWELAEIATGRDLPRIHKVLRTAHGWLLVGGVSDPSRPFLASSSDGATWQVLDTSKLGEGGVVDATVTKSGDLVIVGRLASTGGHVACSVAWVGPMGSLRRVDLGCDDVVRSTTTLADGRVIVVGAKDVWVRS